MTRQLFDEGDWLHARQEALRDLTATPDLPESSFILTICNGILGERSQSVYPRLESASTSAHTAAPAHFALATLHWANKNKVSATHHLAQAFLLSDDPVLTEQSARLILEWAAQGSDFSSSLLYQAESMRSGSSSASLPWAQAWGTALKKPRSSSVSAAGILTGFYRTQISPAIGSRCPMHPSCSTYFRQAAAKHGFWMAVPMIGDRFIREPHHYKYRIRPVNIRGKEKSFDPIDFHDYWFKPSGRPPLWHE